MNYLVLDVETTTKNKGHPFTPSNKLCCIGSSKSGVLDIEYTPHPFGHHLQQTQKDIDDAQVLVGFNFKFDLHWLRRYGIKWSDNHRIHDCQLAYFLETHQKNRYPSLNEVSEYYGFGKKLDVVADEYWSKGIDTPNVPWEILAEYTAKDIELTEAIYLRQLEYFEKHPKVAKLFRLQCQDLLILQEMEWNGLLYDSGKSLDRGAELSGHICRVMGDLGNLVGNIPINWNSPEQVSAVLYGGVIKEEYKEKFLFHYADKKKEPVWKERNAIREHQLPRLVEPLRNSSTQKEGVFATGESVLKELLSKKSSSTKAKKVIKLLLSLAELSKLHESYVGIPELIKEMEWEDGVIHGNFNQCNVITGRLSSNNPNLQNQPPEIHECVVSRFGRGRFI